MLARMVTAAAFAWFAASGAAQAQVAAGPNSVDAPYVHVDWGHGRVHVVAPFVNLCIRAPAVCQATGYQAEPIPAPPPVQTSLRPSASKQIVTAAFSQPVEKDEAAALPTWSATRRDSSSSREQGKALAHDIARSN
jgi:hypothetical protein